VYAVRGAEPWQDDVVLAYKGVDFYLFKDQVWQVGLEKTLGIALGDPERAVNLVFPHATREAGPAISVRFNELPWPAELRVNLNNAGKVSALYLYRANF
jgi:hypothetical protein